MPLLKRKAVPEHEIQDEAFLANKKNKVFQMRFTNEIFANYEDYIHRFNLYRERIWSCSKTGKTMLTYEEALMSEKKASEGLVNFPKVYQHAAIPLIHFSTLELKALVEHIYEHFRKIFFPTETVEATIDNNQYEVEIIEIDQEATSKYKAEGSKTLPASSDVAEGVASNKKEPNGIHADDMEITKDQVSSNGNGNDNENENDVDSDETEDLDEEEEENLDGNGAQRSPKKLRARSSSNLAGDSAPIPTCYKVLVKSGPKNSPLISTQVTVNHSSLSRKKGIITKEAIKRLIRSVASRETYIGSAWIVEGAQNYGLATELPPELQEKRDKYLQRGQKKQKEEDDEDKVPVAPPSPMKIKYPIEDSLLRHTQNDPKLPPSSHDFAYPNEILADLFAVWTFLQMFGEPLSLSPFPLEDFEKAVDFQGPDCTLTNEFHIALLAVYLGKKREQRKHFSQYKDSDDEEEEAETEWHGKEITYANWKDALLVALKKHDLIQELGPDKWNAIMQDLEDVANDYLLLPTKVKLQILTSLVNRTVNTNTIKNYMDKCSEESTELTKEKMNLEREIKKMLLEREEKEKGEEKKDEEENRSEQHSDSEGDSSNVDLLGKYKKGEDDREMSEEADSKGSLNEQELSRSEKLRLLKSQKEEEEKWKKFQMDKQKQENKKKYQELRAQIKEKKEFEHNLSTKQKRLRQIYNDLIRLKVLRVKSLGQDRDWNKYWFFDDLGSAFGTFGTGRLYLLSPEGEWSYYSTQEEIDSLMEYLDPKGERELALRKAIKENYERIVNSMKRREKEANLKLKQEETRRSERIKTSVRKFNSLQYVNKWTS